MKNRMLVSSVLLCFLILPWRVKNYVSPPEAGAGTETPLPEKEIARLNDRSIYPAHLHFDFNSRYALELHNVRVKLYREQKAELQRFIDRVLLEEEAERNNTTPDELLASVTAKAAEEAKSMEDNKDSLFQEFVKNISKKYEMSSKGTAAPTSLNTFAGMVSSANERNDPFISEVKDRVVEMQKTSYLREKKDEFMRELRSKAEIDILLERPGLIKLDITPDDDPSMGKPDAPVTIVEFVDYQCPFCSRETEILKKFVAKKGNTVRLIQRDFPLPSHKDARLAAEAAECADEQGKFWDYTELLFSNQQSLANENLLEYAMMVDLDREQFRDCLQDGQQSREVDRDITDAQMAGISSIPSLLINGYYISGVPSPGYLEEVLADVEQGKTPRVEEHREKG